MAIKKGDALKIILETAECYEKNLRNRNLLFLYEDKHHNIDSYEVVFEGSNFLHLTGLIVDKSTMPAQVFYQRCLAKGKRKNSGKSILGQAQTVTNVSEGPAYLCTQHSANARPSRLFKPHG